MFKLVYCSIILKPPAWVTFYSFLDHVWTEEETARAKPLWAHQCSPRSVTQPAHRGSGPRQCRCRVATVQRRAPMHGCFLSACGPPLCRSTHRSLLLGLTQGSWNLVTSWVVGTSAALMRWPLGPLDGAGPQMNQAMMRSCKFSATPPPHPLKKGGWKWS